MKALSSKQIEKLKEKCSFFDFEKSCADIEMLIKLEPQKELVRFKEFHTAKDRMVFQYEMKRLIAVVKQILKGQEEENCIILKDCKKWIVEPKETPVLYSVLKKKHISNRKTKGILVNIDAEWHCIELLIKAIFQCNTSAIFVLPKSKCIFAPTDHMDIFVYCQDMALIERLIRQV